jgi:hypothetical protein
MLKGVWLAEKSYSKQTSADAQQRLQPHRPWFVFSAKLISTATWFPLYHYNHLLSSSFSLLSSLL